MRSEACRADNLHDVAPVLLLQHDLDGLLASHKRSTSLNKVKTVEGLNCLVVERNELGGDCVSVCGKSRR